MNNQYQGGRPEGHTYNPSSPPRHPVKQAYQWRLYFPLVPGLASLALVIESDGAWRKRCHTRFGGGRQWITIVIGRQDFPTHSSAKDVAPSGYRL